ncbi:hypothetical protein CSAL01_12051 [Colletotrichum salicis]|uniref:PrpF protein n=1 Tax=Colletotrichum salicis TaxID=1209931 RepID=A0A135UAG6_9PEZI|nr:hypothetical protein CSAL01_12051 [Colletotrichum salicis]
MAITPATTKRRVRHSLPAVLMRAGTLKGLFIHRSHLPSSEAEWATPLLAAMGSKYNDARQIDGVGGGSSVTSKVAVVSPSSRPGVDVEYTFIQVAVGSETVGLSGNCGNICSGVGPCAVQERLIIPMPGSRVVDVRIFNTNTPTLIVETVYVDEDGNAEEDGDCLIPGVKGPGSEIKVAFVEPVSSMTGKLFPSRKRCEKILVEEVASLGDFAPPDSPLSIEVAEAIRRQGAVQMGLASTVEAAGLVGGTPKLAYVPPPAGNEKDSADIRVQAYSMGKPHPSLQLTGGVTLAYAAITEGTVAHRVANRESGLEGMPTPRRTPSPAGEQVGSVDALKGPTIQRTIHIQHDSGIMEVEVWAHEEGKGLAVDRYIVTRTARRLMEGNVFYYS